MLAGNRSDLTPDLSAEGAVVTVVTRGADESFSLTEAQEDELIAAMAEIERGEFLTLEDLLQSLPTRN
jgi:predicted transcriptional regulator